MIRDWVIRNLKARPRVCIFCGKPPRGKNKEHVIPRWLIELTGDPNRIIHVGPFTSRSLLEPQGDLFRSFSFESFSFPSCSECNSEFSELEGRAKGPFTALLNSHLLSSGDLKALLSWFDKVRVGLWLGFHYYLDHNYWGVSPHFYIRDRIAAADRALVVLRAYDRNPGIRFIGVNTPAFAHVPSCFTLVVNEWFLLNISYQFIASQSAGLPYPESMELGENEHLQVSLVPGKGKLSYPLLPISYDRSGVTIAQAIHPRLVPPHNEESYSDPIYEETLALEGDQSMPLLEKGGAVSTYPNNPTTKWLPAPSADFNALLRSNAIDTLAIQNDLIQRVPISSDLPEKKRQFLETEFNNCIEASNSLLRMFNDAF